MATKTNKLLQFLSFFLVLFLLVGQLAVFQLVPSVKASVSSGWYYSGWNYRKEHNLTSSSAVTDYQVKFDVYNTTGTDSGNSVYLGSNVQVDFDDVRWTWYNTSSNSEVECDYWIESYSSNHATFWVEVPSIPSSGNSTIYIYYGKSDATTTSNGDNTFIFFDDFPGTSLDTNKWVVRQGDVSVADSQLKLTGGEATRGLIDGLTAISIGAALHLKAKGSTTTVANHHFVAMRKSNDWNYKAGDLYGDTSANKANFHTRDAGSTTATSLTLNSLDSWHTYKLTWKSGESKIYQDDTLEATHTTNVPTVDNVVVFYEGTVSGQDVYVDWCFVRKYVSPEPSHGSWGSEEEEEESEPPSIGFYWGVEKNESYAEVTVNWLAGTGRNISGYIFNWKGQNESWVSLGGDSDNETVTIYKSIESEPVGWISWQMWVNDTEGEWNTTGQKKLWVWKEQKIFNSEVLAPLGQMNFWSRGFYYNGSKEAIYVAYINTSTTPWSYYCRAYDVENDNWTVGYYIADLPEDDTHHAPSIGLLPDKRLLLTYGYYSYFKIRTSVYSADTENNLTKLITNWNSEQTVYSGTTSCYPYHAHLQNTSLVLFRDGGAQGGDVALLRWKNNVNVTLWVNEWDETYDEWESKIGSSPYLDDSDDRVATYYVDKRIGDFKFEDIPYVEQKDSVELYIQCSSSSTAPIEVYLYNGTGTYSLGTSEWYGWKKWDVTQYFSTTNSLNTAEIRLTSRTENESYRYVYRAYLKVVNTTGFIDKQTIATHSANLKSPIHQQLFVENETETVVASWVIKEVDTATKVCLAYSEDEGITWKFYNGTTVSNSPVMGNFTVYDLSDYGASGTLRHSPVLQNNKFTILCHEGSGYGYIINGTLGQSSVDVNYVTYYNNTKITFSEVYARIYVDPYHGRPAFWTTCNNVTGFAKFVQYPENVHCFKLVYQISNYNSTVDNLPLVNPQESYENIVKREKSILGNLTVWNMKEDATNDTLYGVKFTASSSGYVTTFRIYVDFSDPTGSFSIKYGIYNSTLHLIGNGSTTMVKTPAERWFSCGFSPSVYVYYGQTYWLAFKFPKNDYYDIFYKETTDSQASFTYTTTWSDSLPNSISSPDYQNRTYTVCGRETIIEIIGTSEDTIPPTYSNIGTNTTKAGYPCLFYVKWSDNVELDGYIFGTNNTGHWVNDTWTAWSNSLTTAWSNITKTLNDTCYAVAWQVWANDTSDNWNSTGIQYLIIAQEINFSFTETATLTTTLKQWQESLFTLIQVISRTESVSYWQEQKHSLYETTSQTTILNHWIEKVYVFFGTVYPSTMLDHWVEIMFMFTESLSFSEQLQPTQAEAVFTLTQTITPSETVTYLQEQQYILTETADPTTTFQHWIEGINVFTETFTETLYQTATVHYWIEISHTLTETLTDTAQNEIAQELLQTMFETLKPTTVFSIAKELVETFITNIETVHAQATLYKHIFTPTEEINTALVLAAFAAAIAIIALSLTITKKD